MIFGQPYYRLRRERRNRKGESDEYFYLSKSNIKYDTTLRGELERRAQIARAELEAAGKEVFWIIARYDAKNPDPAKKIGIKCKSRRV